MRRFAIGVLLVSAVLGTASDARAARGDAGVALRGLNRAVAAQRLSPLDAHEHRRRVHLTLRILERLPSDRQDALTAVLRDVAAQASTYDAPRALTLFTTLELNAKHLLHDRLPTPGHDVSDWLGVVYRSIPGRGLRFHPLGSFGQLNAYVTAGRQRQATSLAYALLARARGDGRGLTWEYGFRAAGGDPPWTSGMAQAVAAQALARAGLVPEARLAFAAIPGRLLNERATGTWIRLYAFSDVAVLNAQLQAALSLADYAQLANDEDAALLATDLRRAALRALPAFDTGYWSRYALGGSEAPLSYHQYVTSLLWKLARSTGHARWAEQAARFRDDWRRPPAIRGLAARAPALPLPRDGFRDAAAIRFWLSKPAHVELTVAGERLSRPLGPGLRTMLWQPGERRAGRYPVELTAVDRVGNRTETRLDPVVIARDTTPPALRAETVERRIFWRARDRETPWLTVEIELRRGGGTRIVRLPQSRLAGSHRLVLRRPWYATLSGRDSSGNRSVVALGRIGPTWRELAAARAE
ncbi:MAG: D-glucuronyl C5-epimerase family protein [Gaiellaceae bacterium MAG52_C11]|nr:D-glucuronyl C5-epimerase family protein [Candidatus Gaiellasilicea maunaloa]